MRKRPLAVPRCRSSSAILGLAALLVAGCGDNANQGKPGDLGDGEGGGGDLTQGVDFPASIEDQALPLLDEGIPSDLLPMRECEEDKACAAPNPFCDVNTGKCFPCVKNEQCPDGQVCTMNACVPGCGSQKGCGDAGVCDVEAGLCKVCKADVDCADPTPRCDVNRGLCVPCLPMADNCPMGKVCVQANGAYECAQGCKKDDECKAGDGGLVAGACCGGVCVDTAANQMHCGACGKACAMGQSCCNSGCVDLQADVKNCGGCGNSCNFANATGSCTAGKCAVTKCNDGFDDCDNNPDNGCEVDIKTDVRNCTGCGKVCNTPKGTPGCNNGCTVTCDPGFGDCNKDATDGCEVELGKDLNHCGGCGMACGKVDHATSSCDAGKCVIMGCEMGWVDCDQSYANGCEINTQGDVKNCGMCGKQCGQVQNGTAGCAMGACGVGGCSLNFADCNKDPNDGCETNSQDSLMHCGACGNACPMVQNGTGVCALGLCQIAFCKGGFKDCNNDVKDGCEINLGTDLKNCGDCGKACPNVQNGAPVCNSGVCDIASCNAPFKDCNNNYNDGCETNTANDVKSCGGCAVACPAIANATPACSMSKCVVSQCSGNFKDCNGTYADGCEVNTDSDVNHCGACNNNCPTPPNGAPSCVAGKCGIAMCGNPFRDCNANPGDGCETNTSNDVNHCGNCGNRCAAIANGTAGCANSSCGIASCNAPFRDCAGGAADGCETNTSSNVAHCGACGNRCPVPANATAACTNSTCGIGMCNAPFADCRNGAADGCETNTANDARNCGGCDKVCPGIANGSPGCAGAVCGIGACNAPFRDCGGGAADGCETNSSNNVSHCGACGNVCRVNNGTPGCGNGTCNIAGCSAGYRDCNGGYANGCETNINTDVNNCGGCGTVCRVANGTPSCTNGGCAIASCNAGYRDCGGGYANGCETNINTDANNCGACGNRCASGVCTNGSCLYAPSGVQNNVPVATVTGGGWTQCYIDRYNNGATALTTILNACNRARLMLACRATNSTTLRVLAWAPRGDVTFDTGQNFNTTRLANGVYWYYNTSRSWGFSPRNIVYKNTCDTSDSNFGDAHQNTGNGNQRVCYHTGSGRINGGWRCGDQYNLNLSTAWERVIYHAN